MSKEMKFYICRFVTQEKLDNICKIKNFVINNFSQDLVFLGYRRIISSTISRPQTTEIISDNILISTNPLLLSPNKLFHTSLNRPICFKITKEVILKSSFIPYDIKSGIGSFQCIFYTGFWGEWGNSIYKLID